MVGYAWRILAASLCMWVPAVATAMDADLSRLGWLEGCWHGEKDGIVMEETWSGAEGQGLLGMHKDVRAGKMVAFEFFRVTPTPKDGVCYFASPQGAPATPFGLVEIQDQRVVFENRAHDFPQRIAYWLDASGKLHARIEGSLGGRQESEEWVWTKCAAH